MTSSDPLSLHDATLLEVRLNWESGECIAFLKGSRGAFQVTWSDVTDVHLPRRLDWGPAVSVLSATELEVRLPF
jgi:hypothetical protein